MLWKKIQPDVIAMRKNILLFIIGFVVTIIFIIVVLIIRNTSITANNTTKQSEAVHKYATQENMGWFSKELPLNESIQTNKANVQNNPTTASTNLTTTSSPAATNAPASSSTNASVGADEIKAMTASISSNQITGDNQPSTANMSTNSVTPAAQGVNQNSNNDQNMQGEKKAFLQINGQPNPDDYLSATVQNPQSSYEVQAGTIIPGILITGINSGLPGQITAQVRSNVYDSISGRYLLIPQGAKLTGLYDSQVAYGQERVLIVWNRIILPNGQSIDLQGMPGIDLNGYAGFNDQVNNHYIKMFGSVLLMSVMSAGAQLSQPQQQNTVFNTAPTIGQVLAQSLGTNIANTGTMIAQKDLNIQPTLIIRPGYEFNISVTKDMVFPNVYSD